MQRDLLYEHHRAHGALLRPQEEPSPLLSYGDVPAEYRAAREACVIFDETDRGLVRVAGSDSPEFLHRILANRVQTLEAGQGNRNLLLTGKGKVLFDFDLAREEEGFRLSTPPGAAAGLLQGLDTYLFGESVELVDASEEHAPVLVAGPGARDLLAAYVGELPESPHEHGVAERDGRRLGITRVAPFGGESFRLDGGPELAPRLWDELVAAGARPSGRIVADSLRVEACRPLWGEDVSPDVYPQEARLEEAFDLSKGCYIGQEVVAKIDTYGGVNKLLCPLRVSHDDPVAPGTRLFRQDEEGGEWRDLGVVTSWAYSFLRDGGQVLAYLKRRHQEVGTTFRIGEGPAEATVVEVPGA